LDGFWHPVALTALTPLLGGLGPPTSEADGPVVAGGIGKDSREQIPRNKHRIKKKKKSARLSSLFILLDIRKRKIALRFSPRNDAVKRRALNLWYEVPQ